LKKNTDKAAENKPVLPAAPRSVRWLRAALAVSILLLMGAILLVFHYWSQMATAHIENRQLKARYDSLMQVLPNKPDHIGQGLGDAPKP